MLKIAILGPESTGKTMLAEQLAAHFHTDFVPEYSREYLKDFQGKYSINDVIAIAKGQQRSIDKAAKGNEEILISDTEAIVNKVWCEYVFKQTPKEIEDLVQKQDFDLYLLCDTDLEWTFDPLRENPDLNERKTIFALYLKALNAIEANYAIISGQGKDRFENALKAINEMNKAQRHIVFLARWYPHKYDPMFGLFVQRHAEAAALYNKVTVVYVHADTAAKAKYDIERDMENGVDTIRIYYKKTNRISSAIRFWKACQKGLEMADQPDLIHVHVLTRLGVVAWWEKLRHNTPYMITEHWSRYLPGNDFHGLFRKIMTKTVVKNADMVTTVTDILAQAMQQHGLCNPNYAILPNVVDAKLFKPIPHHNDIPKIIHVSCFEDKSKNITGLLHSLKALKDNGINYQASLIGDGMDFAEMCKCSEQLKLNDRVRFTGVLEGQELFDEIASGDFFVLSSNYETASIVVIEALMCGLPVVSTKVGCVPDIINENNGIVVPVHDENALTEAMAQMCEKYKNYNAQSLRDAVIDNYGKEKIGQLLTQWYQGITEK